MKDLNEAILAAHAAHDHRALVGLYTRAAEEARSPGEAGFFLTQAYVFALETAHENAASLHARLVAAGREA